MDYDTLFDVIYWDDPSPPHYFLPGKLFMYPKKIDKLCKRLNYSFWNNNILENTKDKKKNGDFIVTEKKQNERKMMILSSRKKNQNERKMMILSSRKEIKR